MAPTPKATVAPPRAAIQVAGIPRPPPGLTSEETERWQRLHHFRNQIDAIRNHLQPPGTHTPHLNELTFLYFNEHVARRLLRGLREERYASERSLFSRYSRDQRVEDNLHLATIGFPPVTKGGEHRKKGEEQLRLWNWYLRAHRLPEVNAVGTGLPDALRDREGVIHAAATILVTLGTPAAGPFTSALRAAPVGSAVAGPSSSARAPQTSDARPRDFGATGPSESTFLVRTGNTEAKMIRQAQDTMIGATVENDEQLHWALQYRRNHLRTYHGESDEAAITTLAIQFFNSAPRASAREALLALARASWDLDEALYSWDPENGDDVENGDGANDLDDEGQPPHKGQRLDNSVDDDGRG